LAGNFLKSGKNPNNETGVYVFQNYTPVDRSFNRKQLVEFYRQTAGISSQQTQITCKSMMAQIALNDIFSTCIGFPLSIGSTKTR